MSASPPQAPPAAPQDLGAPIEPDVDDNGESDSAYANSLHTFTTSIGSSVLNYKYENGRRYHAFHDGEYPLPNDEKEQDRLVLLHHIFKPMLRGALYIAPTPPNPQRVLDFGTGTGIWALDMADENPSAEVIGTDLSPIQPSWVAPNSRFIVDDVEDEWVHSDFDFVHGRGMAGSIKNWEVLYARVLENLKPGGFLEMQEYETWIRSDDETLENCPFIMEWQQKVDDASRAFGKRMNVAAEQKEKLIAAGFEDVTEVVQKLPIGPWPKDPRQKEIGRYELVQMVEAVEPFTLAIFTRTLGWSNERAQALMAGVRSELQDRKNHLYALVHFVYGKKPRPMRADESVNSLQA